MSAAAAATALATAVVTALFAGATNIQGPGTGRPSPAPERGAPLAVPAATVRVTAVVDGDTLRVQSRTGRDLGRVRLLGIDAPEVAHGSDPAECYGDAATDLVASMVPVGTVVTLRGDPGQDDRDIYGRLLRYVDHRGHDLSLDLLEAGAVRLYDSNPPLRRHDQHRAAFDQARADSLGLWDAC